MHIRKELILCGTFVTLVGVVYKYYFNVKNVLD